LSLTKGNKIIMESQDKYNNSSSDSDPKRVSETLHDLKTDLFSYIEKRLELFVIQITEPFAGLIARLFQQVFGFMIALVGVFFVWGALALLLGEYFNSLVLGLLVAGLPLLFIGALLFSTKPGFLHRLIHSNLVDQVMDSLTTEDKSSVKESSSLGSTSKSDSSKGGRV